jgi:spoIIIJ-associated protein
MPVKKQEIEASGQDVEEAVISGLGKLGVSRDQVEVEILEEGRRGLLGIGGREAVVRLRVVASPEPKTAPVRPQPDPKPPQVDEPPAEVIADPAPAESQLKDTVVPDAVAPPADEIDTAVTLVRELLSLMKVEANVSSYLSEPDDRTGRQLAIIDIKGDDLSALIGPRGENLDALQYMSRLMVGHRMQQRTHFVIDIDGYRERRQQALTRLAERMAGKAVKRGSPVTLEAMPAHERRIIHMALRDVPEVTTESTGEGKRRRVRIYPK